MVYIDGAVPRVLESLSRVVVSTAESRQAQTCAEAVRAFTTIVARLRTSQDRACFDEALDTVLPAVIQHAELPTLRAALAELRAAMDEHGRHSTRVTQTQDLLTLATQRLLPKPSDEPEAAHPR
ncbi:hypothetical protein ABZU32_20640 [Sphaerisporangium sp. NPDC005288]|uniref:hypothetical protein n=1 Tax=Sphaerisporangium sp. NPDC005288 TaxID=3155114 RepID=UPI0033AD0710